MKRLFILGVCFTLTWGGFAQELTPEVIASSGEYDEKANGSLSWTLGEVMTETYSSTDNNLTQGFQQPELDVTVIQELNANIEISVFPNPVAMDLKITTTATQPLRLVLMEITGKQLLLQKMHERDIIPMKEYANGTYFLRILDEENQSIKTFKIVKTQ